MSGAPQVAMRSASQIWQIFFPSQTLQVFCFSFAKPSDFLFGPSQKGTICSSDCLATRAPKQLNYNYPMKIQGTSFYIFGYALKTKF